MASLKNTDGFMLHGWMVNELHLEGGDLIAFALVHQFTQSNAGVYNGNTSYLSAWTGWTEKTSKSHLQKLTRMGLIQEIRGRENNTPFCHYKLAPDFYKKHCVKITESPSKNFQKHSVKISESTTKKLRGEYNNIENNIGNISIPPTPQEVEEYARSRGFADPVGFSKHFVDYYGQAKWHLSNGKPMKDWKKAVITWEPNNKHRIFEAPTVATSTKRVPFDINTLR